MEFVSMVGPLGRDRGGQFSSTAVAFNGAAGSSRAGRPLCAAASWCKLSLPTEALPAVEEVGLRRKNLPNDSCASCADAVAVGPQRAPAGGPWGRRSARCSLTERSMRQLRRQAKPDTARERSAESLWSANPAGGCGWLSVPADVELHRQGRNGAEGGNTTGNASNARWNGPGRHTSSSLGTASRNSGRVSRS